MAYFVVNALRHDLDSARKDSTKKDDQYFYHLESPAPEHIFDGKQRRFRIQEAELNLSKVFVLNNF